MPAKVIDVDPDLLRRNAEATSHAALQGLIHVNGEIADNVPELMKTLVPEEPYAFTLAWQFMNAAPDAKMPIGSTRAEVESAYVEIHQHRHVVRQVPLVDIRGAWYTFQEGETTAENKDTGEEYSGVGLVLFPVGGDQGITGELLIGPRRQVQVAADDAARHAARLQLVERHDEYLHALANSDVAGILKSFTPDAQSGIRDYVHDTGTLVVLDGEDEHRSFYEALLSTYTVRSVDIIQRVVQHWYVFCELRVTMGDGDSTYAFHTAEIFVPGPGYRFIDRIGHGTDLARV